MAIPRDRIVAVGALAADAPTPRRTIDARGLVVAPGFIDVHTHSDGWLLKTPNSCPRPARAFTTEVLTSDGISYAPVNDGELARLVLLPASLNGLVPEDYRGWRSMADYLALLDRRTAQNMIAADPLRQPARAGGRLAARAARRLADSRSSAAKSNRPWTPARSGFRPGWTTSRECFATTDELVEACRAMAPWRGLYVTHVRYKKGTLAGVQEAVEIGRRAGVPVHISHLKAGSAQEAEQILAYVDRVAVHEVDFSFDIYPYLPGSTMLNYLLPYEVWEDGPLAVVEQAARPGRSRAAGSRCSSAFGVPAEKIVAGLVRGRGQRSATRAGAWRSMRPQQSKRAGRRGGRSVDRREPGRAVRAARGDDRLVEPFLQHPKFMLGSDGI